MRNGDMEETQGELADWWIGTEKHRSGTEKKADGNQDETEGTNDEKQERSKLLSLHIFFWKKITTIIWWIKQESR